MLGFVRASGRPLGISSPLNLYLEFLLRKLCSFNRSCPPCPARVVCWMLIFRDGLSCTQEWATPAYVIWSSMNWCQVTSDLKILYSLQFWLLKILSNQGLQYEYNIMWKVLILANVFSAVGKSKHFTRWPWWFLNVFMFSTLTLKAGSHCPGSQTHLN